MYYQILLNKVNLTFFVLFYPIICNYCLFEIARESVNFFTKKNFHFLSLKIFHHVRKDLPLFGTTSTLCYRKHFYNLESFSRCIVHSKLFLSRK